MRVEIGDHVVTVFREPGAQRARTESDFWFMLKEFLNRRGHDLVKKVMCKDGHMMGDDYGPYYLRDRKWRYYIYDGNYALRAIHLEYNRGDVALLITRCGDHNLIIPSHSA